MLNNQLLLKCWMNSETFTRTFSAGKAVCACKLNSANSFPGERWAEQRTRTRKIREEKRGEKTKFGRRGEHLVVICMERYLLCFSPTVLCFSLTDWQSCRRWALPGKIKVQAACLGVEAEKEEGETRGVRVGGWWWWWWWVTVNKGCQLGQLQRARVTYRANRP